MLSKIKAFFDEDKKYYQSCEANIVVQNNGMLKDGCIIYAAVLSFYTILSLFDGSTDTQLNLYYVFDVIHFALCVGVLICFRCDLMSKDMTKLFCILLELSILGFFALEGALVSRTEHSLYVPIAILMVLLLFIHRIEYSILISTLYILCFTVTSALYKTPQAYKNDLYIAIASFFSSLIGCFLIAKMRHREGMALNEYTSLSRTDQLTGLYNKSTIEAFCKQIMEEPDHGCAFIIIDLDDFKSINDTYGHDTGDAVLISVGQTIKDCFRDSDLVGRFGGDEFIVIMDRCEDLATIISRVTKIIKSVSTLSFHQKELSVQCSAGITLKKEPDSFTAIFKRSDQALYEAKKSGKGQYRIVID